MQRTDQSNRAVYLLVIFLVICLFIAFVLPLFGPKQPTHTVEDNRAIYVSESDIQYYIDNEFEGVQTTSIAFGQGKVWSNYSQSVSYLKTGIEVFQRQNLNAAMEQFKTIDLEVERCKTSNIFYKFKELKNQYRSQPELPDQDILLNITLAKQYKQQLFEVDMQHKQAIAHDQQLTLELSQCRDQMQQLQLQYQELSTRIPLIDKEITTLLESIEFKEREISNIDEELAGYRANQDSSLKDLYAQDRTLAKKLSQTIHKGGKSNFQDMDEVVDNDLMKQFVNIFDKNREIYESRTDKFKNGLSLLEEDVGPMINQKEARRKIVNSELEKLRERLHQKQNERNRLNPQRIQNEIDNLKQQNANKIQQQENLQSELPKYKQIKQELETKITELNLKFQAPQEISNDELNKIKQYYDENWQFDQHCQQACYKYELLTKSIGGADPNRKFIKLQQYVKDVSRELQLLQL